MSARARRPSELMPPAEYAARLEAQAGVCPICLMPPKSRRLDIDHDHKTGEIRGLLTHRCNRGLQMFGDDPARLRRAAAYLESARG